MAWYDDTAQYVEPTESFPLPKGSCATLVTGHGTMSGWANDAWRNTDRFSVYDPRSPLRRFVYNPQWGLIMASTGMCCIDIDDHDGRRTGFDSMERFDMPPTLAKISRSGRGRHLYYLMPQGMGVCDMIGVLPGVDWKARELTFFVRGVTLHNGLEPVELPEEFAVGIRWRMERHDEVAARHVARPGGVRSGCPYLCRVPIPEGERNSTLNSWGYGLACNGWVDWYEHVNHRGRVSGLDRKEIQQIIRSIRNGI